MTAGGSAVVTAGNAGAVATSGAGVTVAGAKSSNGGGSTLPNGGSAGSTTDAAGVGGNGGSVPVEAAGGAGGAGGEVAVTCEDAPIPLKGSWKASASHSSLAAGAEFYNPPEYLMDLSTKRWSTGKPQAGNEWLQIDFGASAAIRELSFTLNPDDADDYPRIYQIMISDTPLDFNGTIRASGAGAVGQTLIVTLAEPVTGRYLLVQQKGKAAENWWSVSELSVVCF